MKRQRLAYRPAWTHHPRGGFIAGFAGPIQPGLYGPERGLALTEQHARAGEFFAQAPASQVQPGTPPAPVFPPQICPHCGAEVFLENSAHHEKRHCTPTT